MGKGGAGAVYRVRDLPTGRVLALKQLAPEASKRLAALFDLEYYTLSSLRHPHIVEAYDYGTDRGGPYYTMELLAGADLAELSPLPWPEACKYVSQAASALGVLHLRRLIHRDVSPRNVRRMPDGSVKLLDFGALTAFGSPGDVVGTAPFVAPEALAKQSMDQRSDLYGLGALLYLLVTGVHAYPARSLRALRELWQRPWVSPSQRVAALDRVDLPEVPPELDAVIEALLSQDICARPFSTAELIDRLGAITGSPREQQQAEAAAAMLPRAPFTGRARELRAFRRLLGQARSGRGGALLVESKAGGGRSRLLEELALDARIAGTTVVTEPARVGVGFRSMLQGISLQLLDAQPELARAAALPHARVLSSLSQEVAQRLGAMPTSEVPALPGEERSLLQEALCEWLISVARQLPLVLLIDGLERADETFLAWVASVAAAAPQASLLLVASLQSDAKQEARTAMRLLREGSTRLSLIGFSEPETQQLMQSMFGEVAHLGRLSHRLQHLTGGNPGHIFDQLELLIREELITHIEGTWVLPQEIPAEQLLTRENAVDARLGRLSAETRGIVRLLSQHRGALSLELCIAVADTDVDRRQLFAALEMLVREGILVAAGGGYRFVNERCREALAEELEPAARARARARIGAFLLSTDGLDPVEELEACVHVLQAGDDAAAEQRVAAIADRLAVTEPDTAGPYLPALEQALALYVQRGRDVYEQLPLLSALTMAGYYVDRRYSARYAGETLRIMAQVLKLQLARRLRPFLGKRLSLYGALLVAALGFSRRRRNPRVLGLRTTIVTFFGCVAALSGVHTVCVDPDSADKMAELLEPWTGLGERHTASFMHMFARNLAATVRDRLGEAYQRWQEMIATLEKPENVPWIPELQRQRYLGGALYAFGVLECWRDGPGALRIAERLEGLGMKLYEMSADQLRTVYYANQGNLELYKQYRERAELHAIRRGTAWQVETWAPMASITPLLRVYDVVGMKQSLQQLHRLAKTTPSLVLGEVRVKGAYHLLRKRYRDALPWLEQALLETPQAVVGWARSLGALAHAYNGLGEHEKARALCERTIQQLAPGDLDFPAMNLGLQIQRALAESGLGNHGRAAALLDALLEKHAPHGGPLTLGALHEARARAAMAAGDEPTCQRHTAEMAMSYRGTRIPSLIGRCEAFEREVRRRFRARPETTPSHDGFPSSDFSIDSSEQRVKQLERVLSDVTLSDRDRYERTLAFLADDASLGTCGLWIAYDGQVERAAVLGELPAEIDDWVRMRLTMSPLDDVTQTESGDDDDPDADPDVLKLGDRRYRLYSLIAIEQGSEALVGGVVIAEGSGRRRALSVELLQAAAARLVLPHTSSRFSLGPTSGET